MVLEFKAIASKLKCQRVVAINIKTSEKAGVFDTAPSPNQCHQDVDEIAQDLDPGAETTIDLTVPSIASSSKIFHLASGSQIQNQTAFNGFNGPKRSTSIK